MVFGKVFPAKVAVGCKEKERGREYRSVLHVDIGVDMDLTIVNNDLFVIWRQRLLHATVVDIRVWRRSHCWLSQPPYLRSLRSRWLIESVDIQVYLCVPLRLICRRTRLLYTGCLRLAIIASCGCCSVCRHNMHPRK